MQIDFQSIKVPRNLPADVSLALYRVLQEALQNAVKHSRARKLRVSPTGGASEIALMVQDSGVGFEPREAIAGSGLALASMKERMKLVEGELSIDSHSQRGTTIHARVPFDLKSQAARAGSE